MQHTSVSPRGTSPSRADLRRYRVNWQGEVDEAALYRAMAASEPQQSVAEMYAFLAESEERHARFWERRLAEAGERREAPRPSWRARVLIWAARRWGARRLLPTMASHEYLGRNDYAGQQETVGTGMTDDEHLHSRLLRRVLARSGSRASLRRIARRRLSVGGNALRAAVLGANDGLCSNLSLVMGVAGAAVSEHTILLTGVAGLLAGACSMAIGEWLSVTSARELARRDMHLEREQLRMEPEEAREELQLIYEMKGFEAAEARELSAKLLGRPSAALDLLIREELGIDPDELGGSAWTAAGTSLLLFAAGAFVPVAPFLIVSASWAVPASLVAGSVGLFCSGAAISVFTGRSLLLSGGRQLALGLAAAGATFGVGRLIGVAVAG